jgi:hypothetical protein
MSHKIATGIVCHFLSWCEAFCFLQIMDDCDTIIDTIKKE